MGRSRYKTFENGKTYFITSSAINWLPVFAIPQLAEIVTDSLNFLHHNQRMRIHAWVLMETHLHLVATSSDMSGEMKKAKSYTARSIVDYLKANGPQFLLDQMEFYKKKHKQNQTYQVWQEGFYPKLITDATMLIQKIEYIHYNPVKRGYIDKPEHWRYSSARDYTGLDGIVTIERLKV
ncbi:MAG: transposase [Desulfobacteraceae bacterium]|nr:transposase [Desulfobacteraceae bacterium]MBC2756119.1 transposase [Desulfobacteraceae bacterium]MBC2763723.1 transposase [ANME-2 cluster archaeon]